MSKLREAWDEMRNAAYPEVFYVLMDAAITEAEAEIDDLKTRLKEAEYYSEKFSEAADRATASLETAWKDVDRLTRERDEHRDYAYAMNAERDAALATVERMDAALARLIDHYAEKTFTGVIVSASEQYPWIAQAMAARKDQP